MDTNTAQTQSNNFWITQSVRFEPKPKCCTWISIKRRGDRLNRQANRAVSKVYLNIVTGQLNYIFDLKPNINVIHPSTKYKAVSGSFHVKI